MARENVELIKEQLRAKTRELNKLTSKQSKKEEKYQHLIEVSKQKIDDMKKELDDKEQQIKKNEGMGGGGHSFSSSVSVSDITADGDEAPTVVEKEVIVQDPKLVKALNKLRKKNGQLEQEVESHQSEKAKLEKQRTLLTKEIKRVRKQPDMIKQLKQKAKEIEEKARLNQDKYIKVIDEKEELIKSYESVLFEAAGENAKSKLPSEIIRELKDELQELRHDKERLENELFETKKQFDRKLSEKIKILEDEWGEKLKKLRKEKAKLSGEIFDEPTDSRMVTYADMVTLLLTFFILYYSIASVNMQKFKEAIIGEENASIGLLELLDSAEIKESIQNLTGMKSNDILNEINEAVEETELNVDTSSSKIVVTVPGSTLFATGGADLTKAALPVLDEVIRITKKHPNYKIHIQGHTDDEPISTERFPTNWELSAARATAVLRYFIDKGSDPKKLTATGYADTFPLATNDSELGRAKNRRVEFVLEKEKKG